MLQAGFTYWAGTADFFRRLGFFIRSWEENVSVHAPARGTVLPGQLLHRVSLPQGSEACQVRVPNRQRGELSMQQQLKACNAFVDDTFRRVIEAMKTLAAENQWNANRSVNPFRNHQPSTSCTA
jgi:hypothetical protein